ncbi:aromatic-ring-hydroxylating dioxygenase subunit beta [Variovorax paradoxus]|uniref:aromatic-ring-hydroxylating dioxygenase subunit beta n=1 Tax=Variovorax paradoxus TaxID=34073 RepID=UPI003ECF5660
MSNMQLERLLVIREIEEFIYHEAALADAHQYEQWLSLWSEELLYWAPCNRDDIAPDREVSLIYDDRPRLEERIFRLQTKHAHSQSPKSHLSRTIGNVTLGDYDLAKGGEVHSRFFLAEDRLDRTTVWAGRQVHVLEKRDGQFHIRAKHVFLVNNDSPMGNLTFLI